MSIRDQAEEQLDAISDQKGVSKGDKNRVKMHQILKLLLR